MEQAIVACDFNFNGNLFAFAVSYDWSKVSVYNVLIWLLLYLLLFVVSSFV